MPNARRAFSLTELLVVIAIIAVLAGLLFPVFGWVKRSAKAESSKQYLRQQYVALELYAQGNEGALAPWGVVQANPSLHAPCSPLDDWRTPCWSRPSPMLGSYGYARPLEGLLAHPITTDAGSRPLLADVFSADYRLPEFSGPSPDHSLGNVRKGTVEMPDRVWFVYTDGSLREMRNPRITDAYLYSGKPRLLFSWPALFDRQMQLDAKGGNGGD